jgi:hypothetical protein
MFKKLIDWFLDLFVPNKVENDPIFQVSLEVLNRCLTDENYPLVKYLTEETKQEFAEEMYFKIEKIVQSDDKIMANRVQIVESVLTVAKYGVLVTTPEVNNPCISGVLKDYIKEIMEKDKAFKDVYENIKHESSESLINYCLFNYYKFKLEMSAFNSIRLHLGDNHQDQDKDWLLPFLSAMSVRQEHEYRKLLGLPDLLSETKTELSELGWPRQMVHVLYGTFAGIILKGTKDPYKEFLTKPNNSD